MSEKIRYIVKRYQTDIILNIFINKRICCIWEGFGPVKKVYLLVSSFCKMGTAILLGVLFYKTFYKCGKTAA